MILKEMIVIITVLIILSYAIFSIIKMKKKGTKCIGCPSCSQNSICNSKTAQPEEKLKYKIIFKNPIF